MEEYYENLLGVRLERDEIDRSEIKFGWLNRTFRTLQPIANDNAIQCHIRRCIFQLLGERVFHDKTSSTIYAN